MADLIRVLIADDHEAVRSGVRAILAADDDIEVVGEAENGFDALSATHRLGPDVALIDLRMPGTDGVWAAERITAESPTRVIVLTTYDSGELVSAALAAGAHGYLLKSTSGSELIDAVKHVAAERHVLDPAIAGSVIAGYTAAAGSSPRAGGSPRGADRRADLTPREAEVLSGVVAGLSNPEIAARLHIGLTTVKTHVGALYAKSGTSSRVQLAAFGLARDVSAPEARPDGSRP